MDVLRITITASIFALASCSTTKPLITNNLAAKPFTIIAPKNLIQDKTTFFEGIILKSFIKDKRISPKLEKYYSVEFAEQPQKKILVTSACNGERITSTNSKFQSCIHFDSRVIVEDNGETFNISLIPYQARSEQGRNALFFPISPPSIDLNNWYGWVAKHNIKFRDNIISKYSPESIKANFDRSFMRLDNRAAEEWLITKGDEGNRQFFDRYLMKLENEFSALVAAHFYPYKDGSMVELIIEGRSKNISLRTIDWITIINQIQSKLQNAVHS